MGKKEHQEPAVNIELAWPWMLAALPLALLAMLIPAAADMPAPALRFPFFNALRETLDSDRRERSRLRLGVAVLVWMLLVVAAARPQRVGETLYLPVVSRSVMLAVDLSGSMRTSDMRSGIQAISRLAAVKEVGSDFINHREGDRLGLILFGDEAYVQVPLTLDRNTVITLLNEAEIGLAGRLTAIGDAIGLAIKRLRDEPIENRVLILLTDGASNAGNVDPLKAADLAARDGVRIYTIGVGANETMLQGPFGLPQLVSNDLDEGTLRAIAHKTGGRYFRATDLATLAQIYDLLDKIEPVSKDEQSWRPVDELYAWPLAAALLLSVLIALSTSGLIPRVRPAGIPHA
jgi:Ca-activated chloride channel family protein